MKTNALSAAGKANLIDLIGNISGLAAGSTLSHAFLSDVNEKLATLSEFLECSEMQSVLFSIIFNLNLNNKTVTIEQIASWVGLTPVNIAALMDDLEELRQKNLIRKDSQDTKLDNLFTVSSMAFTINPDVFNALRKGEPFCCKKKLPANNYEVIKAIAAEVYRRKENDESFSDMWDRITPIIFTCRQIPILRNLRRVIIHHHQRLLFIMLSHDYYQGKKSSDLNALLRLTMEEGPDQLKLRVDIEQHTAKLVISGLIEVRELFFKTDCEIRLSAKGIRLLTNDIRGFELKEEDQPDKDKMHHYEKIETKNLIFPPAETEQLNFLENLLMPANYKRLTTRLKNAGMSHGVSVMFYGPPGTGKTESVYQLAKKTGRDLMPVTISETKSKWFGESERLIKEVFDHYKKVCEHAKTIPILLFNEADGIFGQRKELGHSPVDQTENAIQNIILQEMEDLKGIMIATTNMMGNFDKAFERRFLYKIRFEKPDVLSRSRIWQEKIPWLVENETLTLAEYDLSGGQIENVARKALMYDVLHRKRAKIDQLQVWCEEEIFQKGIGKVGYKI